MSGKVSGQVWDLDLDELVEQARAAGGFGEDGGPIEKQPLLVMLLALADHADHEGRNVRPGVDLLVWKTGLSERRVRGLLSVLRVLKLLVAVRYLGGGRGHTTEYRLDFKHAPHKAVREKPAATDSVSDKPCQETTKTLPGAAQTLSRGAERVQPEALNPVTPGTPTGNRHKEPSKEPSEPARARAAAQVQPIEFTCPLGPHTFVGDYGEHIALRHKAARPPPRRRPSAHSTDDAVVPAGGGPAESAT